MVLYFTGGGMVKADSSLFSFRHMCNLFASILTCAYLFFVSPISADDISPPTFLTAISDQNGEVPLFWFCPHPETSELVYHGDQMLDGVYVLLPWKENCVGVRMSSTKAPFHLLSSKVFICGQGSAIDSNYNYQAPFFVTVNQDSGGIPRSVFLDSVSASANGDDSLSGGQWVKLNHNILMEDSVFWIIFHWLQDFPMSPLVGEDNLPNQGNSFWGRRSFFHFEWHLAYHNLMMGAEIVTNPDQPSEVDSFRVYRSTNPDSLIYQKNIVTAVPGEQFEYKDSGVEEDCVYFYRATAFNSHGQSRASNLAQAVPRRGAQLETDKESFMIHSTPHEQTNDDLTLINSGGLPLWFKVQLDINEATWMGGSDGFGYTWTDNLHQTETGFDWVKIQDRGVRIGESGDDNVDYGFFDLGFSFPFYDNHFDSLRIASDGWLSFSHLLPCYQDSFQCFINRPLPWLWGPYYLVAPFWDDLKLADSSAVYLYSNGDSAIVSFLNILRYTQGGPYSFQTILTRDGGITYQYLHMHDSVYSATVGIQNRDGTVGMEILCNERSLCDSQSVRVRPAWVKVDTREGWIAPGESQELSLTFDPLTYPRGIYHADVLIESWDQNHQLETKLISLTFCIDTTTSVDWQENPRPKEIFLFQNYPNPFNALTTIEFTIDDFPKRVVDGRQWTVDVSLKIYNLLGQLVRILADGEMMPGAYRITWDGKDEKGREVSSGIYFCRLAVDSQIRISKMLLLK
jgi:hypothetical protein